MSVPASEKMSLYQATQTQYTVTGCSRSWAETAIGSPAGIHPE